MKNLLLKIFSIFLTFTYKPPVYATIISLQGQERIVEFKAHLYLPVEAAEQDINKAITKQIKTAFGSLTYYKIYLNNLENPLSGVTRLSTNKETNTFKKVTYLYQGKAIVSTNYLGYSSIPVILLTNDYTKRINALVKNCAPTDFFLSEKESESFWYYFHPNNEGCLAMIHQEEQSDEIKRLFLPIMLELKNIQPGNIPETIYPEYQELYDLGNNESKVVFYLLGGSDVSSLFPYDRLATEQAKLLNQLFFFYPPTDPLLNVYKEAFRIILNQKNESFEAVSQANRLIAEKWIKWENQLNLNGKIVKVEFRTYYGNEALNSESEQSALLRYKEAFKEGDVIVYNGHSHLGKSALRTSHYSHSDFKNRSQIFLLNGCNSFGYYDPGFLNLKQDIQGQKTPLALVLNGGDTPIEQSGEVVVTFVKSLLELKSYQEILSNIQQVSPAHREEIRLIAI